MNKILLALFFIVITLNSQMYIKKNNLKKEIIYNIDADKYVSSENYIFDNDTNLMIKFNKIQPELIKEFEEKYELELKEVMIIGYYVYKSNVNVIDKINEILQEGENINTIIPNWKRVLKKR